MKKHGYRSRRELNVERAKKEREVESTLDIRLPIDDCVVDTDGRSSMSYTALGGDFTLDGILSREDDHFLYSFKLAPPAGKMLYVSAPCRPFFTPEDWYRAAIGGKSETSLAFMRHETSRAARDLQRLTERTRHHRVLMTERFFDPMFEKFVGKELQFTPEWHSALVPNKPSEWDSTATVDSLMDGLMKTIAELPPPRLPPKHEYEPYSYQRQMVDFLEHEQKAQMFWPSDFDIRRHPTSLLNFGAPYRTNWYKLNRLTHKLHTMHGDYRPHKINVAPEGIE